MKNEVDRAIADYDQAIALDPKLVVAYGNRAAAFNKKGEFDRAIADCDRAIALNPKHVDAYFNRGVAYGKKSDTDKALIDLRKALEDRSNVCRCQKSTSGADRRARFTESISGHV